MSKQEPKKWVKPAGGMPGTKSAKWRWEVTVEINGQLEIRHINSELGE